MEQYCDTLPAVGGSSDPTGTIRRRLASVLPRPLVHRLDQAGVLGEVLLALPAADSASRPLPTVKGRRARFRPGVAPLLPGPAMTARSLSDGAATSSWVSGGLGWVLVATMFSLALISLWGHLRPE